MNYPSNTHSVELPLALKYFSELFNKPDGLVKDAVEGLYATECPIANNYNSICTLFLAVSRRVLQYYRSSHFTIPHRSGDYPLLNQYPSGLAEIFATLFHACVVRAPISNAPSLLQRRRRVHMWFE